MGLIRLLMAILPRPSRTFFRSRFECLIALVGVVCLGAFVHLISLRDSSPVFDSDVPSGIFQNNKQVQSGNNVTPKKIQSAQLHYPFVETDLLAVDADELDKPYKPPENFIQPPRHAHYLSRLLTVKGESSSIIFHRIPQCLTHTTDTFLQGIAELRSFTFISSQISTPMSYNASTLFLIARAILEHNVSRLLYGRYIHFFDYYDLKFATHPIWISLVRPPFHRIAADYEHTRRLCRENVRCLIPNEMINETLDQCVTKRAPQECIRVEHGIVRMLPFFCGQHFPVRCRENTQWAFDKAKENIEKFYTVIGLAEDFYKFLYVLEKILPNYFKLARLWHMNSGDGSGTNDRRDYAFPNPNASTISLLKPHLKFEDLLYEYLKKRFFDQYNQLVELDL